MNKFSVYRAVVDNFILIFNINKEQPIIINKATIIQFALGKQTVILKFNWLFLINYGCLVDDNMLFLDCNKRGKIYPPRPGGEIDFYYNCFY